MRKKVILDLKNDVPLNVGYVIPGKFVKRYYGTEDIPMILGCIVSKINVLRAEQGEQFDVVIFGNIQAGVFGSLAVNLSTWVEVRSLVYIRPGDEPVRIFPE